MLGETFSKVIQEYQNRTNSTFKSDDFTRLLTESIPRIIKERINVGDEFKLYGSCGVGNWAETPWVAILKKSITESTQSGYYVCYLINADKKWLYLCLAPGWTQFAENFPGREASDKIAAYSKYLSKKLTNIPTGFNTGPIDLSATHQLSKGYEKGQIISKRYAVEDLRNEDQLTADLRALVGAYNELSELAGDSVLNIDYTNILEDRQVSSLDKQINQATLQKDTRSAIKDLVIIAEAQPPKIRDRIIRQIVRKQKFANFVKTRADYICEICGREPFLQANGAPYAEADHIVPLGDKGMDHPDNMRCLCPQCHAVITNGSENEMRRLFE